MTLINNFCERFFWVFQLAVTGVAGLLVANAINAFVREAMRLPPGSNAMAGEMNDAADQIGLLVPTERFRDRNVFRSARESVPPGTEVVAKVVDVEAAETECVPSTLAVKLVGTFVSSRRGEALATFAGQGRPTSLRLNERLLDVAEVVEINRYNVRVNNAGRCEVLSMDDLPVAAGPSSPFPPQRTAAAVFDIRRTAAGEFEVARSEIEAAMSNWATLAQKVRIVPNVVGGRATGFKLFSIRPGTIFTKLGVQNGDVIQKINGHEMSSPQAAMGLLPVLTTAEEITVDVVRRGRRLTLRYRLH